MQASTPSARDSKMPRGQGRRCRQRGVVIQLSAIPRMKTCFKHSKFLSLCNRVSLCCCLNNNNNNNNNNCSPITVQQSTKTSDVKQLLLDTFFFFDQLVLPRPVSDTTSAVIAWKLPPASLHDEARACIRSLHLTPTVK